MSKAQKPIQFKAKTQRRAKVETAPAASSATRKPAPNPRTEIRGRAVGSTYEANVADALDFLGWDYWYQYAVGGGRDRRGGMVLDFLIWTRPAATPVWVNGRYWHNRRLETDLLQQSRVKTLLGFPCADPLVLWDEDCQTVDDALNFLLSKLGRN